jgi:TolB-like protein
MPDIFLSYSRDDQPIARRFAEGFKRAGFSVWWDATLNPGEAYDEVTEKALQGARAVVVLWSRKSVASRWVRAEATQAQRNGTLVPAMIEACARPIMFELTHTTDLSQWSGDDSDEAWQSFLAGVRRYVDPAAQALAPPPARAPQRNGAVRIAIPLAVLALAGVAVWWFVIRSAAPPTPAVSVAAAGGSRAAVTPAGAITLAVLPFVDMSPARDQEYFSDGLTEELLNQLAQIRALRVTARTSSFSFKGKNEDLRVVGQKLEVGHILEGSVRKDGTQLRITAQLINTRDGGHEWSKSYDRELSGVFALQEEVAKDVAKALSITLDVGELPRIQGGTNHVGAYDKYLQARELNHQGGRQPALQAAALLREAVVLDPEFSRAWYLLVTVLPETMIGVPNTEADPVWRELETAARRVHELAPESWWSLGLRADQFIKEKKLAQAESAIVEAKKVAEATSIGTEVDVVYGQFLLRVGRIGELVQLLERARQTNPLSLVISSELQLWLGAVGQATQAQEEYLRSKQLAGTHQRSNIFALLRTLAHRDASPASIKAGFKTILDDERLVMPVIHALAESFDDPGKVRSAISQAIVDPRNQDQVRMSVITLFADAFGEKDLALSALRRAAVDFGADTALWMPKQSGMRSDPRFKEILRAAGLVDYFRSSGKWGDFCMPLGADDFECR